MGTPKATISEADVMGKIFGKDKIADEEWLNLISARIAMIEPWLRRITLPTLDKVMCLRGSRAQTDDASGICWWHSLENDSLNFQVFVNHVLLTHDLRKYVEMPGIYFFLPSEPYTSFIHVKHVKEEKFRMENGDRVLWGLNRNGHPLVVRIDFKTELTRYNQRCSPALYERAHQVLFHYPRDITELSDEVGVSFSQIFGILGNEVKKWLHERESAVVKLKQMVSDIDFTEKVIRDYSR